MIITGVWIEDERLRYTALHYEQEQRTEPARLMGAEPVPLPPRHILTLECLDHDLPSCFRHRELISGDRIPVRLAVGDLLWEGLAAIEGAEVERPFPAVGRDLPLYVEYRIRLELGELRLVPPA